MNDFWVTDWWMWGTFSWLITYWLQNMGRRLQWYWMSLGRRLELKGQWSMKERMVHLLRSGLNLPMGVSAVLLSIILSKLWSSSCKRNRGLLFSNKSSYCYFIHCLIWVYISKHNGMDLIVLQVWKILDHICSVFWL